MRVAQKDAVRLLHDGRALTRTRFVYFMMVATKKTLFVDYSSFPRLSNRFRGALRVGACFGFSIDFFTFRPKSHRIQHPRRAKDSADHAGHDGAKSSRRRPLLCRFAKKSGPLVPDLGRPLNIREATSAQKVLRWCYSEPKGERKERARARRSFRP